MAGMGRIRWTDKYYSFAGLTKLDRDLILEDLIDPPSFMTLTFLLCPSKKFQMPLPTSSYLDYESIGFAGLLYLDGLTPPPKENSQSCCAHLDGLRRRQSLVPWVPYLLPVPCLAQKVLSWARPGECSNPWSK
jgi:hypothetical protein